MKTPAFLVLALALSAAAEGPSTEIVVREVNGEVDYQIPEDDAAKAEWHEAKEGARLSVGAKVATGIGSTVLLAFGDRALVVVEEAAYVRIDRWGVTEGRLAGELNIDPGDASVLLLRKGPSLPTEFKTTYIMGPIRNRQPIPEEGTPECYEWELEYEARREELEAHDRERVVAYGGASMCTPYDVAKIVLEAPIDLFIADVAAGKATVASGTLCDRVRFVRGQAYLFESGFPAIAVYLDLGGSEDLRDLARKELASMRLSMLVPRWPIARECIRLSPHGAELEK